MGKVKIMLNSWTKKYYLEMNKPSEEDNRTTKERILDELKAQGHEEPTKLDHKVLQEAYGLCEEYEWSVTASLVFDGMIWHVNRLEAGDTTDAHYGIAVDNGSTTIVMEVYDLNTGVRVAKKTAFNPQIKYGEDILSRIFFTREDPANRMKLQKETAEGYNRLMNELTRETGIDLTSCGFMVISANTCMVHFLLGYDAFQVFSSPYAVQTLNPDVIPASELNIHMNGYIYIYPSKANYLGGDIISGMIATDIPNKESISFFLDIGTNGELVIGNRDFLICGAGAAGPALEGGSVKTGMRADRGAVDTVVIENDEVKIHVLTGQGNVKPDARYGEPEDVAEPKGICGSGIVDLLAQLFLNGIIDIRGQLNPDKSRHVVKVPHPEYEEGSNEEVLAFEYAPGLLFYQFDIDEIVKTKAAAMTMVEYMMGLVGLELTDIGDFYISGAFGTHLNKESAVVLGMYPDLADRRRIRQPGNTSLDGAVAMLLDRSNADKAGAIIDMMEYVQFGAVAEFLHLMVAASAIPHTDLSRYPSVVEELKKRGKQ